MCTSLTATNFDGELDDDRDKYTRGKC